MYNEYMEDGHSKAAKKRIKARQDHNQQRMLDSMNFKKTGIDENGNITGTVKMDNGPEVKITLDNKNKEKKGARLSTVYSKKIKQ